MSIFGIFQFCMQSYQLFAYEKSSFKLLFFEDSNEPKEDPRQFGSGESEGQRRTFSYPGFGEKLTPRSQLRKQLSKEGTDFSMSYLTSLLLLFLSSFCCCVVNRFDTKRYEGGWYRRNM